MRFKAKLAPDQVSVLYSMLIPISRLASSSSEGGNSHQRALLRNGSILYLDDEFLRLSVKGKNTDTDGIVCFAELKAAGGIFLEHRIESAADRNVILMEIDLAQLKTCLQSIPKQQHHDTILKLAKRNQIPCLCVETHQGGMHLLHHIPVRILRPSTFPQYAPPQPSQHPTIQIMLESIQLRVDRWQHAPTVTLLANRRGELVLETDQDACSIRSYYSQLSVVEDEESAEAPKQSSRVRVDTAKLSLALAYQQQQPALVSQALLCLCPQEMLILHLALQPSTVGFFTYYVPIQYNDEEDE